MAMKSRRADRRKPAGRCILPAGLRWLVRRFVKLPDFLGHQAIDQAG